MVPKSGTRVPKSRFPISDSQLANLIAEALQYELGRKSPGIQNDHGLDERFGSHGSRLAEWTKMSQQPAPPCASA
jgi:hypothetical protein